MAKNQKPILFSVDDDPQTLRAVKSDLRSQYRKDFRIISTESAREALDVLPKLKKEGAEVALFLSDQRMPEMLGVDFLESARHIFPRARRVLLTAYSDIDAAIRAINDIQLDYYLIKPWDPPEEKLYPVLDDLLEEWWAQYKPPYQGLRLIGYQYSPKSHALKDFLSGNLRPYQWMDAENQVEAQELLKLHDISADQMPAVILEDGAVLLDPDVQTLAQHVGLQPKAQSDVYDVTIIGAGPAGLAAAVYGGSEGLKTLLIEKRAPGGQAGTSSRIENYLGFPKGLSGQELTRRALTQATRFGIEFLSPQEVIRIVTHGPYKTLHLADGTTVNARAVVITTGVDYRRLPAEGVDKFAGAGVYYGAATTEAVACRNKRVFIVGGGNSAGQGAVYLSQFARQVTILIRKPDLTNSMSAYLIDQIEKQDNIDVQGRRQVVRAQGEGHLSELTIENMDTGASYPEAADALFVFIGARPHTDWLGDQLFRNQRGFLETGRDLMRHPDFHKVWKKEREPFLLETSEPGIFAAGDVRSGAMNRVASAVGEGAMAIKLVHEYLGEV